MTGLGAVGDGVAATPEGRIFVPLALPGERWRVRPVERVQGQGWRAAAIDCLRPAPARATPICPHFGRCGGCRLQHLPADLYQDHKRQRVLDALARRGLPLDAVSRLQVTPPASRRRLRLALSRRKGALCLGLRERGSHDVEPVTVCPIARPELQALLPLLAEALGPTLEAPLPDELSLTLTDAGVDLLLQARRPPTLAERMALAQLAERLDLPRVSWRAGAATAEPVAVRRSVTVRFGGHSVALPPGAFLQATRFGEEALRAAVRQWSAGAASAADLFAGLGTLTFALAEQVPRVMAVEGDAASAAALAAAAGRLAVTARQRDLARRPLLADELAGFDLVVLDPPRAGAEAQAHELARSGVSRLVYASCHPESFARDARILLDAGFALVEVRPIDQFLHAAEVELVARFSRTPATRAKRA